MIGKNSHFESTPKKVDKFNSASMGHIYRFLTDHQLIELQPVSRTWRQDAIKTIENRANEVALTDVNSAEKKNVLFIYQCLQNLKNADGSPKAIADFIPEVSQAADPWFKIRQKINMQELAYTEIHELVRQELLNRTLLKLCQDDREKAALVMASPFLRYFLPRNQLEIPPPPSVFHRIFGAIITGIGGFIISILTNILLAIFNITYAAMLLACTPFMQFAVCIGCIPASEFDRRHRRPRRIVETGLFFILHVLYSIIHPFYCLLVGGYYGGKRGVYAPYTLIRTLEKSEGDIERYVYNYPLLNILSTFPGREIPVEWSDNIAESALQAERIIKQAKLPQLITTSAFAASQRSAPGKLTKPTAYTPLKEGEENLLAADYGSVP
jgi:hypothetical protein